MNRRKTEEEKAATKIKWREKNKEKLRAYRKQYNEEHKEETKETYRKWCEKNKEKIKIRMRKYYDEHKDSILEYTKDYSKNNRDHLAQTEFKWRNKNRLKIRERNKKYYQDNIEQIKEYTKKYHKWYYQEHTKNKKKGKQIMKEEMNWTEVLKQIDAQIAKLMELKESIQVEPSNPTAHFDFNEEEVEVDRYGFKKRQRRVYYELPDKQVYRNYSKMKHVTLEDCPDFELYENGELFSRKEGRFIDGQVRNNCGDVVWRILDKDGNFVDIWKRFEMEKYFPEYKEKIQSRHGLHYS